MKAAIEIIGIENCTGCFGCYNSCLINHAITMEMSKEGFYIPVVSKEKCIECGKCQKGCPIITNETKNKVIESYGAWSKTDEILLKSSSGGIFSELSKIILKENGIIYGAVWENGKIIHREANNLKELEKLRGSKYLQSNIGKTYSEIIKNLKNGKKVLFSGTPCQVAALNNIIKHKNLYTIDFICHGVPSYRVFEKYCKENFEFKIEKVDFRNKVDGWINFSLIYNNILKNNHIEDKFFYGFLKDIYLNNSCYNCKFRGEKTGENRQGDITLADFWGVPKDIFNEKGVSIVLINNLKGKELGDKIKNDIFYQEVSLETGIKNNPSFYANPYKSEKRDLFFKELEDISFEELEEKYFKKERKKEKRIKKFLNKFFKVK